MRKQNLVLAFITLCHTVAAQQGDFEALQSALLKDTPIENDLQELCDQIGGRVTGSQANKDAVTWALDKFQKAGVSAALDPFIMPTLWLPKATQLTVVDDPDFQPQVVSKFHSPVGTYNAELVSVGMGTPDEITSMGDKIKDKFILVEMDLCLDIGGLFAEYAAATTVELEARKAGVKGIIFMASRPNKLLYRFITSKAVEEDLPQLVMAREDAKRCQRRLANGEKKEVRSKVIT